MAPYRLPNEIYSLIFQHFSTKADLLPVCFACRVFRDEGYRILYQRLTLTRPRFAPFIITIATSPHLALLVQELNVQLPLPHEIEAGLRLVMEHFTNLRLLALWGSGSPRVIDVFDTCTQNLRVFNTDAQLDQDVAQFIASRPKIHTVYLGSSKSTRVELRPLKIPNLTSLTVLGANIRHFTGFRSIQHLQLKLRAVKHPEAAFAAMQFIGPRLLTFALTRSRKDERSPLDSLAVIAGFTPNLVHFSIIDSWESESGSMVSVIATFLMNIFNVSILQYMIGPDDITLAPVHWPQLSSLIFKSKYPRSPSDRVMHLPRSTIADYLFGGLIRLEKLGFVDISFTRGRCPKATYTRVGGRRCYERDRVIDEGLFEFTPWQCA